MRLTEKQLQEIKQKITHIDDWLEYSTGYTLHKNLIDTIEALQQENEQLREKQCEITQLRNDLQLAWNKIEDLTIRNEILESIHRQCPLTKPKSCTCRSDSQNSTGSSSKL